MKGPAMATAVALVATSSALDAERIDCRHSRADDVNPAGTADDSGSSEGVLLPDNDVFRPVLADQREARFYADYRRFASCRQRAGA